MSLSINRANCSILSIVLLFSFGLLPITNSIAEPAYKSLSGDTLLDQGDLYLKQRNWGLSKESAEKYLSEAGENADVAKLAHARHCQARGWFGIASYTGDFSKFEELLTAFEEQHPTEVDSIHDLRLAWSYSAISKGNRGEGDRRMRNYIATYPEADEVLLAKKHIANKMKLDGNLEGAITYLETAMAEDPDNKWRANVVRTVASFHQSRSGKREDAIKVMEDFLAVPANNNLPEVSRVHYDLGAQYYAVERLDELTPHMMYVIENGMHSGVAHDAAKYIGWAHAKAGNPEMTIAWLSECIERYPDMPSLNHVVSSRTSYQLEVGGHVGATEGIAGFINNNPNSSAMGDAVFILSRLEGRENGYTASVAKIESIVQSHSGKRAGDEATYLLVEVAQRAGDPATALARCRSYLELYPQGSYRAMCLDMEPYLLYQTDQFNDALVAAQDRIEQVGEAKASPRLLYVISLAGLKYGKIKRKGPLRPTIIEGNNFVKQARLDYERYLTQAKDEHMAYTLDLYFQWHEYDNVIKTADAYLERHPDGAPWSGEAQLWLGMAQAMGFEPNLGGAGQTLDILITEQEKLSDEKFWDIMNAAPGTLSSALGWRISIALKEGNLTKAKECAQKLKDSKAETFIRNRMLEKYGSMVESGE